MRLFVGIPLDEDARADVAGAAAGLRASGFEARFEPPEKYHVTLAFLGHVDPELLSTMMEALSSSVADVRRFELGFDCVDAFPDARRPRVVYVGCREPSPAFVGLQSRVRATYRALDFQFRQDDVPHVTIARVKERPQSLPQLYLEPFRVCVRDVVLFQSLPDGGTTRYETLGRKALP